MKILTLSLIAILMSTGVSSAATLEIGGTVIPYQAPDGFIEMEADPHLTEFKENFEKAGEPGTEVLAMYIPLSTIPMLEEFGKPQHIVVITTNSYDASEKYTSKKFALLKKSTIEGMRQLTREPPKELVDEVQNDNDMPRLVEHLDGFADTDASFSMATLLASESSITEGKYLGAVFTVILSEGKVFAVNNLRGVSGAAGFETFRKEALDLVVHMGFPEQTNDGWHLLWGTAFLCGLAVLLSAAVVWMVSRAHKVRAHN